MAIDPTRDPHARIVVKPLPSQVAAAKAKARAAGAGTATGGVPGAASTSGAAWADGIGGAWAGAPGVSAATGAAGQASAATGAAGMEAAGAPIAARATTIAGAAPDPFLRAPNEDDDGYDPYSDRPAPREPLFQEDPWA